MDKASWTRRAATIQAEVQEHSTFVLMAVHGAAEFHRLKFLTFSIEIKILVWISGEAGATPPEVTDDLLSDECFLEGRVAMTGPDGTTRVFGRPLDCFHHDDVELDLWRPLPDGGGSWQRGGRGLFKPLCGTWRRPSPQQPLQIVVTSDQAKGGSVGELVMHILATMLGKHPELVAKARFQDGLLSILRDTTDCRLDLYIAMFSLQRRISSGLSVFPWGMTSIVVVVPADMGNHPGLLHELSDEFTDGLWCATGVTMLVVAALLLCLRRGRRTPKAALDAVLEVVTPLLGQFMPPGMQETLASKILSSNWVLVTVVIAAAYQGQLLSDLTVLTPHHEIDTVAKLADSKLPVLLPRGIFASELPAELRAQARNYFGNTTALLQMVAEQRTAATLLDPGELGLLMPWLRTPRKLFAFLAPMPRLTTFFASMKGSPYVEPLRDALSRLRASGLVLYWLQVAVEKYVRSLKLLDSERTESQDPQDDQPLVDTYYLRYLAKASTRPAQPIDTRHVLPAFVLLGVAETGSVTKLRDIFEAAAHYHHFQAVCLPHAGVAALPVARSRLLPGPLGNLQRGDIDVALAPYILTNERLRLLRPTTVVLQGPAPSAASCAYSLARCVWAAWLLLVLNINVGIKGMLSAESSVQVKPPGPTLEEVSSNQHLVVGLPSPLYLNLVSDVLNVPAHRTVVCGEEEGQVDCERVFAEDDHFAVVKETVLPTGIKALQLFQVLAVAVLLL
ncbi:uncharacterized protein LOC117646300 [Thrips palmi]|uniref:Uncharacterized protein LOC117646300 n=1 Tax=Thrips palmi TaxID=161013 RepID=A0A6P8Z816_THRPL|nr:uncharacterized protein LOC117646300 [Thrips palmi]